MGSKFISGEKMKSPKGFRGKYFSLSAILALSTTVTLASSVTSIENSAQQVQKQNEYAGSEEETPTLEEAPVVVISKKIKTKAVDAPFASEIYTSKDIKNSHPKNLYDFLNTYTSVTTLPTFGNPFTQKIDLRGYGLANGYQNIVISLNGRRLNNIDMTPQLLSSIPIGKVERIEIIKGSGSVEYGDGANAGVINIVTKDFKGISIKSYIASHDTRYGSFGFGVRRGKFSLEGYIDKTQSDGDKVVANDGTRDKNDNSNKSFKFTFYPKDGAKLYIGKSFSKMHVIYPNALTLLQYDTNPKTVPSPSWGVLYNKQYFKDDILSYGFNYAINDNYSLKINGNNEDKVSDYITYSNRSNYDYNSYNASLNYKKDNIKIATGVNLFYGKRENSTVTKKDNLATFLSGYYFKGRDTFSLGFRREKIKYKYNSPTQDLAQNNYLNAYEFGYNHNLTKNSSLFANFTHSFEAPDIDRFFLYGGGFNGFIKPMKVDTYNLGYKNFTYPNRLKLTLFYANIKDEIYYDTTTYKNTNLDKTRKYGVEVYDKYNIHYNLFVSLNYNFVATKIKKNSVNSAVEGREIPGVAKHSIKLSLGYNPTYKTSFLLTQIYRSRAYAMSDFDGNYGKMPSYNMTNFKVAYKYKKFNIFAKVDNIFDKKNALFADNGVLGVYPSNYERTFMIGVNAKF